MAKNFSEQISDVKVTLNRLNQVKKSDCKTGSFFKDSLLKWSELNFRKDFIDYVAEVREISETLPQILLHQDVLVQSLLKRFTFEYKNSVEALFDLLEALSRDVGKEFIKYFPETLIKFECLINEGIGHEPEILKQLFTCFARLCKLLHEELSCDIPGTLQITKNLRMHKSMNIRSFTVQGLGMILRRATQIQISKGILHVLREIESDAGKQELRTCDFNAGSRYLSERVMKCESAGAFLAEAVRGAAHGLHSISIKIFTVLFDPDAEFLADSHLFEVTNEMLRQVCSFGQRGKLGILWDTLLGAIRTNLQSEKSNKNKLIYHMKLLSMMVKHNNGSTVENFVPIFEVFELTLELHCIPKIVNHDDSIQQILFELILNICDTHNVLYGPSTRPIKMTDRPARWLRLISIASSHSIVNYLKCLNERARLQNPAALNLLKIFTSVCLVKFFEELSDIGIATASESCRILLEHGWVDREFLVGNEIICRKTIDILQMHESCVHPLSVLWGVVRLAPFCMEFEACHTIVESILDYTLRKLENSQKEKELTEDEDIKPAFAILVAGLQALLTLHEHSNVNSRCADAICPHLFMRVFRISSLYSGPLICAAKLLESQQILNRSTIFLKTTIPENFGGLTSSNRHVRYANLKYLSVLKVNKKEKSWMVVKDILSKFCMLNAHDPGKSSNILSNLKQYEVMLQAISRSLGSSTIPNQSIKLITSACIGALHIKLSSLWPFIISTLGNLLNMYAEAREVFTFHLEETQLHCILELGNKKESKIMNLDVETNETQLKEFIALQINQIEYGVNPWIRLNLLLDTLSKISFSDSVFYNRISVEFLKYVKWEDYANCSEWKIGMQKWVHCLDNSCRGGYCFLGFHECSEIYCKLLKMLQSNDPQLACLAIRCLGQWDFPYLTGDIIDHLQAIATPKKTKQALTNLRFAADVSDQKLGITVIEKQYRLKIVPLVIQVLLPRLHERSSRNISVCKASYLWIAGLDSREIYPLMRKFFSIVTPNQSVLDAIIHMAITNEGRKKNCLEMCPDFSTLPMKSINIFFRNLEDLLYYLGEHVLEYVEVIVPISIKLIFTVARICEQGRSMRVNNIISPYSTQREDQNKNGTLNTTSHRISEERKHARNVRTYSFRVLADLLYRHPQFEFHMYSNDLVYIMEPLLLRLSNECGASTPPVILQVVASLSSSYHLLLTFLSVEESTSCLKFVWEILKAEVASEQSRVMCLDIAENLVNHVENDNVRKKNLAKQILVKHSKELFESLQILVSHPNCSSKCMKSQLNLNLERTFLLISRLSHTLGGKNAVFATIISLKRLARSPRLDEGMLSKLLSAFSTAFLDSSAIMNSKDVEKFWALITPFLCKVRNVKVRSELVHALSILANNLDSLWVSTKILQKLNSTAKNSLDDINFEIRLESYEKLTTNWFCGNSEQNMKAIIFQTLYDLGSSDFALCQAAQSTIQNFIDALSMPLCKDTCTLIFAEIVLPGIKRSMNSTEKSKRAVAIYLVGYLAKTQPHYAPGLSILSKIDSETDFFINITHLQSHRRSRALTQLKVASTSLECHLSTILDYYIPIVLTCLADPVSNVAATAVSVVRQISSKLPWPVFKDILRKISRKIFSSSRQNGAYLHAFASVLENLGHFLNLEDEGKFLDLFKEFYPKLMKLLPDGENEMGSNKKEVSPALLLSCAHLISFIPEHEMKIQLHRLTSLLCTSLVDRSQGVRDTARVSLSNIARVLGATHVPYIIGILRTRLLNGFQLHVLGSITYDILKVTTPEAQDEEVDVLLPEVLPILDADIFGGISEERGVIKITAKIPEARHSRSLESIELLSQKASFPASMPVLLSLVTKRLHDFGNIQITRKIEQILFSIHKGISFRTKLKGKEILVMARSILSFDSSGEFPAFDDIILDVNRSSTQESTYLVNNNPVLIIFALRLIKSVLKQCSTKNIPEGHRKEYFNIFEDIVPVVFRFTNCANHKIPLLCLQILSSLTNMRLRTFEHSSDSLIRQLIVLLNSSSDPQLAQDCLRLLSNLMSRYANVSPSNTQYRMVLRSAFGNIEDESSTSVCHSVLRAILSRRPLLSEIYTGMDRICCLVASGTSEHSRRMCAQIFLQFLLDYPLGARRLQHYLEQLIANLKYECPAGRASVLNTLHAVILKFPKSVLRETAEVMFVPLVVQLGTDNSSICRRSAGETIAALLSRISEDKAHVFFTWLQKWFLEEQSLTLKRLSVQVMTIALQICPDTVIVAIKNIWPQILSVLEIQSFKKDETWLLQYNLLLFIEKLWVGTPQFFKYSETKIEKTIFVVVQLLRHEHEWIQSSSTRILRHYIKMRGDDHSLNSEDLAFQHDGVDLELAVNNSMLLFENNFKCSEISIEMEVLRQSARNITSISLLFLSKNAYSTQKNAEFRAKKGIAVIRRVGRYCIVARNCIREVCIRCLAGIIAGIDVEMLLRYPSILYELIFPCYICIDPKVHGISIEQRGLAVEVLQLLRSLVKDRYFNEAYTSVQSKVKFRRKRRKEEI